MTSYSDKIKAKIKESDVEGKLSDLVDSSEKLVGEAVTKAGTVAHERREDVTGWLDKASETVNSKTEGKYADKVTKVRGALLAGLDKIAEKRPGNDVSKDDVDPEPRGELPPVD